VALLALLWVASTAIAAPIPSKASTGAAPEVSRADRAAVVASLARDEVEERVAELTPEDLSSLAANLDQIQAAGAVRSTSGSCSRS
jgi:hypothetical protein